MTKLRVVEIYVSYQGEGPNTSRPTVFVRFAGCNFKCPGWPCDTQHAIDPKQFGKTQQFYDPAELAEKVVALKVRNICLTGGEVFLQNQESLARFLDAVQHMTNFDVNIECFTNGSIGWSDEVFDKIDNVILDWKLPGSGETAAYEDNESFRQNLRSLSQLDAIKFTIKDLHDYAEAKRRWHTDGDIVVDDRFGPTVYAGVVWGALPAETLAAWMIEDRLPWSLNVQVHKYVWNPDKTGV